MLSTEFAARLNRLKVFPNRVYEDLCTEYSPLVAEIGESEEPTPWRERTALSYRPIAEGEGWGGAWRSAWFHLKGKVPESWQGASLALRMDFGGEALLFDAKGVPHWSFAHGSAFNDGYRKEFYHYAKPAKGGEAVELWVEAASNNLFGITREGNGDPHPTRNPHPLGHSSPKVGCMRLVKFNEELWHLRIEFQNLLNLLTFYGEKDYRGIRLLEILGRAQDAYREEPSRAAEARAV